MVGYEEVSMSMSMLLLTKLMDNAANGVCYVNKNGAPSQNRCNNVFVFIALMSMSLLNLVPVED